MRRVRTILLYKNYFKEFYIDLNEGARKKVNFVLRLIESQIVIPSKFLRTIEGVKGLYEIKIEYMGNIYRVFCYFDKGNIVVLFCGFQKKSNKTPKEQILRAKQILKEYISENGSE